MENSRSLNTVELFKRVGLLLSLLFAIVLFTSAQTTITRQVASGSDDAEQNLSNGSVDVTGSSDLEMVKDGSTNQLVGIRFTGLNIPVGATITNAYFTFVADENYSVATSLVIKAQATDNASSFSSSTNNISNRSTTSASYSWNNIPSWTDKSEYTSPNFANVVQEIVNRGGWVSGNSMVFIISGTGTRNTNSYDGNSDKAVKITITYTTATPTSCTCPGNLVTNPSFENGTTGWGWSGGSFNASTGAVACGSKSGDFQISNNSNNWVTQTIGTDLPIGTKINASVFAGTHDNNYYHQVFVQFFDANWNWISMKNTEVNKVLASSPTGPQLYNINAVVPANTKYTQVGFSGDGNWIKTDQWCVTTTPPGNTCNGRVTSLYFNKLDGGTDIPISNGSTFTVAQIGSLYNLEVATTGTIGSVKYTITGATPSTNIENTIPYNAPGGSTEWVAAAGTHNINIKVYNAADAGGTLCHDTTISFNLTSGSTASIGDRVWLDANGNGLQDASETTGLTGVTVLLKNSSGTTIATTTTNGGGNYLFSGLAAGTYKVQFPTTVGNSTLSPSKVGSNNNIDSDPVQSTGLTANIVLSSGQNITTVDAGYCPTTLAIGNRVWNDANNNGIDNSEAGISGATVNLYKDDNNDNVADGAAIATTTTNSSGNYLFSNLVPGNYIVGVIPPAGYISSATNGGDPDNDFDLDDNGQVTAGSETRGLAMTLVGGSEPNGDTNNTYDFGFYLPGTTGSIGDRVWFDANGNGIQDASETTGLTGITVQLLNSSNTVIATKVTNSSGNYLFTGLAAGTYYVKFPVSISGAIVTGQHVGSNVNIDSDPSQSTGITQAITLTTGQNRTDIDAGYCPINLSLGNRVWYDENNNGLNDSENGIQNVTVYLYKDDNNDNVPDGPSIASDITDVDGWYLFENLGPGNYIVGIIIPPGYKSSDVNGGDPDNDINLDDNGQVFVGNEVRGLAITLIAGTEPTGGGNENITYDFGLLPDCECTSSTGNLLTNASFENGTTGWNWSGGTLTTGNTY